MFPRCVLIAALLVGEADGKPLPPWLRRYTSDEVHCIGFAEDVAAQARDDGRQVYFVAGITRSGKPHALVIVDGWAIDNGALIPRYFNESDIPRMFRRWWILDRLPDDGMLWMREE